MPKVHEEAGCKIYINTDDHLPAHVHVVVSGGVVVINLDDEASVRRDTRVKANDVNKARRIVLANRDKLQKAWDNLFN